MWSLIKNIIGYGGSNINTSTVETAYLYCSIVLIIIGTIVTIDLLYKFFLRFLPRESK